MSDDEKDIPDRRSSDVWDELNQAIEKAGGPKPWIHMSGDVVDPLFQLHGKPIAPYIDILLEYAPKIRWVGEFHDLIRVITTKEEGVVNKVVPFLLSVFDNEQWPQSDSRWDAGDSLYTIDDKESYPRIVEICRTSRYGRHRGMLVLMLPRIGTREAVDALFSCLSDESVQLFALSALGRLKRPEDLEAAIDLLEKTKVDENYEKEKGKVLLRMRKKLEAKKAKLKS